MPRRMIVRSSQVLILSAFLFGLFFAGCDGIRTISDYDEGTDETLTALQQETDAFIDALIKKSGTDDAAFDKNAAFYDGVEYQLRTLEFRVNAIPGNGRTASLVSKIRLAILGEGKCSGEGVSLRDLHCMPQNESRGPSPVPLELCRRNINQTISAALSLELAKKQGLEKNK